MSSDHRVSCSWKYCCDPFKHHKKLVSKGLQRVSKEMATNHSSLSLRVDQKICVTCRHRLRKRDSEISQIQSSCVALSNEVQAVAEQGTSSEFSDDASSSQQNDEDPFIDEDYMLTVLNEMLISAGASPISQRKARNRQYLEEKITKVKGAVKNVLQQHDDEQFQHYVECEVIQQLKAKFATTTARSEKVKILTVLPNSWLLSKIEKEFSVINYMARQAKRLVAEKGILSGPNPKLGHIL